MTVTVLTTTQLTSKIEETITKLDSLDPLWRTKLAPCCLHCSRVGWGETMATLDFLDTMRYLLDGGSYRDYAQGDNDIRQR